MDNYIVQRAKDHFSSASSHIFQIYTMEITLGVFGFLLLLGIIAILAFLGIYRLNDARAYARQVVSKYIVCNNTYRYRDNISIEMYSRMCVDINISFFQVPESERQCEVCSKPKQFIQVSSINFPKSNVWEGSNELNIPTIVPFYEYSIIENLRHL